MKNKWNKKRVLFFAGLLFTGCLIAFVMLKTTIGAGIVACVSEEVALKDYMQIGIMPKEHNFNSYKDMLVYNIRVDKAAERRALEETQRTEIVYEPIMELANTIFGAYTYIEETGVEEDTLKKYHAYMEEVQLESAIDVEENIIKSLISAIADVTHFSMSTDTYYVGYTQEQVHTLIEEFLINLKESTVTEEFVIEQITPGEYDPQPLLGIAKNYADDISQIYSMQGEDTCKYDYIVRFTKSHQNDAGVVGLKEAITAIVSEVNYIVLETEVVLGDERVKQIAADGSVRPFSISETESISSPQEPVILQMAKLQEKADEFVGAVQNIIKANFENEEALDELYKAYYVIEEMQDAEGTDNIETKSVTEEVDYEKLLIAQVEKKLQEDIESRYSVDTEWANIIILSNLNDMMADGVSVLLTERFMNENRDDWENDEVTEEQAEEFLQMAEKIRNVYTNFGVPTLVASRILLPETVLEEDFGTEIASKDLAILQQNFAEGYSAWCEGDVPVGLYGGYYQYESEGIATIEVAVLYTEQGIFITDAAIKWIDRDGLYTDLETTYGVPNTVRIYKEAEAAVNRELYTSEEAYQKAIQTWLYTNYPEYYQNPVQVAGNVSSTYSYGSSYGGSRILQGMRDAAGYVSDVWDGVGYALEGTLPGYLFTNNGQFRNFKSDVDDAVEELKEEANALANELKKEANIVVNGVKNWWYGLWH